jgi:hypothetical protein
MPLGSQLPLVLRRLPRAWLIAAFFVYLAATALYAITIFDPHIAAWFKDRQDVIGRLTVLLFAPLVLFLIPGLLSYLNPTATSSSQGLNSERRIRELRAEVARLSSDITALRAAPTPLDNEGAGTGPAASMDDLRASLMKELIPALEARLSRDARAKAQIEDIRASFANSYTRLAKAVEELNRRGNLNLVIGVITTLSAATILVYMALKAPATIVPGEILAHYIPRLSTVIFIEVFSFFFLRLYKATLDDGKFYQIQLLSLGTVDIALQAAMKSGDASVLASTVAQIARGRSDLDPGATPTKPGDLDAKSFADLLEKFGKLAIEVSKAKGTAG